MAAPVLNLRTLEPERPGVIIDDERYDLAVMSDFGLIEQARLGRLMVETGELQARLIAQDEAARPEQQRIAGELAQLTANDARRGELERQLFVLGRTEESDAKRMKQLLDEVVDIILRAPPEVKAKLSEPNQQRLIAAFTPTVSAMAAATPEKRSRSMSGSSSRGSRRSTARTTG